MWYVCDVTVNTVYIDSPELSSEVRELGLVHVTGAHFISCTACKPASIQYLHLYKPLYTIIKRILI